MNALPGFGGMNASDLLTPELARIVEALARVQEERDYRAITAIPLSPPDRGQEPHEPR
jgi:hypothetical protein